jgi:hypothetical protein
LPPKDRVRKKSRVLTSDDLYSDDVSQNQTSSTRERATMYPSFFFHFTPFSMSLHNYVAYSIYFRLCVLFPTPLKKETFF